MRSATISNLPRGLIVTCLLVVTIWGISEAKSFLIPISISAILAFTVAPLVSLMRKHHFPEWSAICTSAVFLVLPIVSALYILIWQGQALIRDIPSMMEGFNHLITDFVISDYGQKLRLSKEFDMRLLAQKFELSAAQGIQFVIAGLAAVLGAGSQLALVLLFSVLMLASRKHLYCSAKKILTQALGSQNPEILEEVVVLIEKFLVARMLIVAIVAAIDTTILALFDLQYAFLLGSFLGIMTLIPAIGFILGASPAIIVSLAMKHSLLNTFLLFLALFVVSLIEGNILTPKMVGGRLNINALATFIGLFAGGLLWGIWGMFLSIPVLGVLRITFNAAPSLQPWGELLADKKEPLIPLKLSSKEKNRVA